MIQITAITLNDDKYASRDIDVMVCSSIDSAKEIILDGINKHFDGEWTSLEEAASDLNDELDGCGWIEREKKFYWNDNGNGEEYFINRVNEREVNTKYQHIGSIY